MGASHGLVPEALNRQHGSGYASSGCDFPVSEQLSGTPVQIKDATPKAAFAMIRTRRTAPGMGAPSGPVRAPVW